jgi:hypothetical protein
MARRKLDHERMLSWADGHLERAEAAAKRFMGHDPYITDCEPDMKRRTPDSLEYAFTVRRRKPVKRPSEHLVREIGEALHAMRSSLDYLAVHVVLRALPSTNERKVAFPIVRQSKYFGSVKEKCLPGVSGDLLRAFHAAQPCFGPYAKLPHLDPLAILDGLEQPHKHRRLLSATPGITDCSFRIVQGDARYATCLHITLPPNGVISTNKKIEIARWRIETDAYGDPKAFVQNKSLFYVRFDESGPAFGLPAITTLKRIRDHIRDRVFPLFDTFV